MKDVKASNVSMNKDLKVSFQEQRFPSDASNVNGTNLRTHFATAKKSFSGESLDIVQRCERTSCSWNFRMRWILARAEQGHPKAGAINQVHESLNVYLQLSKLELIKGA